MSTRNTNSYQRFLQEFKGEVLVVCPKCREKAVVTTDYFSAAQPKPEDTRLTCTSCGHSKTLSELPQQYFTHSGKKNPVLVIQLDHQLSPFFHLPLWLTTRVGDHLLWAYNYEHLDFLHKFVAADLRERNGQDYHNKSLGSRLPKWMTAKKNRAAVLKGIEALMERCGDGFLPH